MFVRRSVDKSVSLSHCKLFEIRGNRSIDFLECLLRSSLWFVVERSANSGVELGRGSGALSYNLEGIQVR